MWVGGWRVGKVRVGYDVVTSDFSFGVGGKAAPLCLISSRLILAPPVGHLRFPLFGSRPLLSLVSIKLIRCLSLTDDFSSFGTILVAKLLRSSGRSKI